MLQYITLTPSYANLSYAMFSGQGRGPISGHCCTISDVRDNSDIIASALTWNLGIFIMERNGPNVSLSEKSFFQNCQVARIIECPIFTPLPTYLPLSDIPPKSDIIFYMIMIISILILIQLYLLIVIKPNHFKMQSSSSSFLPT